MPRIIVADDDEQTRTLLRMILEEAGYEVETARDGCEAVKLYRENPADLLITDIVMPEKDGVEPITELRRDFPEIKVIATSGGGRLGSSQHYLRTAKGIGADGIVTKPIHSAVLLETVKRLVEEESGCTGKKA